MSRASTQVDVNEAITLSPKRTKGQDGNAVANCLSPLLSPSCVASVADLSLEPPAIALQSPKKDQESDSSEGLKHKHPHPAENHHDEKGDKRSSVEQKSKKDKDSEPKDDDEANEYEAVRHQGRSHSKDENLPHSCWWSQLHELKGDELVKRLKSIQLDEMIDYHGGVLNSRFVEKIVRLYDHVNEQGDGEGGIYSSPDADLELPFWCPPTDDEGFSRLERLEMAAEYDVWQWYLVTGDNYSLLDTLVWMGVQMKKLWSRPVSPPT